MTVAPGSRAAVRKLVVFAALVIAAAAVFLFQPAVVLFGEGHLGWVSSHTLAIIRNATADRFFLGFACELADSPYYAYFDRYPVVFSGAMNLLLQPFTADFGQYIGWARTWMNVIYVLSLLVGYRICLLLTGDRYVALSACLLTFAGIFFVFYKDMIHYDQPAVLGMLVLFYAIARYEMHGETKWVWAALGVVLLGRGYASNFLLLLWNLIFLVELLATRRFSIPAYIKSVQFRAFFIAGVLSAGALGFNVYSEAQIRDVAWEETSIVRSAEARLGLRSVKESGDYEDSRKTDLVPFTRDQIERTVGGLVPYGIYPYQGADSPDPSWPLLAAYLVALFGFLTVSVWRSDLLPMLRRQRRLVLLGLLAGFFWLYPLRNLAAFHNYTHMYNATFYLVFFSASLYLLRGRRVALLAVAATLGLFMLSMSNLREARLAYNLPENDINQEVDRIRSYLDENGTITVHIPAGHRELVEGSPYAACLYFSGFKIARDPEDAEVIVTREDEASGKLVLDQEILDVYGHATSE